MIAFCKGRGAKWNEFVVECFFPQSYWIPQQRDTSVTIDFFDIAHGTKDVLFLTIQSNSVMNRPGPDAF